jgi:hypothetical protein
MKRLIPALAGAALLAAGAGASADDAVVRTHSLEVKERLQYLERIDVTSEKPANPDAEPLDAELLIILEEVEALEAEAQRADDG